MSFGLVVWAYLSVSPHGQSLITRPEQLAGPWEVATSSRVDGIFLLIYRSNATQETIQVGVYHRRAGSESRGWYLVSPVRDTAGIRFDGSNLQMLGLTAKFDKDAAHWIGEWLLDGQMRKVVLERPHPAEGSTPNPLCGGWERVPDTTRPQWSTAILVRIHIVQSADGGFTAWMDSANTTIPQRVESETLGRSMKVVSADPKNVILQNESGIHNVRGRFSGVLSDEGDTLVGTWNGSAPESFRRIR